MWLHFYFLLCLLSFRLGISHADENQTPASEPSNALNELLTVGTKATLFVVPVNTSHIGNFTAGYLLTNVELMAKNESNDGTTFFFVDNYNTISSNTTNVSHTSIRDQIIAQSDKDIPNIDFDGLQSSTNINLNQDIVKLLFIIEYATIRRAETRLDFINMVKHAAVVISNIENYRNRIGLLVAKVENKFSENVNGKRNFVDDQRIFKAIEKFLLLAKNDLEKFNHNKDISEQEQNINSNGIEIIKILLEKSEREQKIAIHRYPNPIGTFGNIPETLRRRKRSEKCDKGPLLLGVGATVGTVSGMTSLGSTAAAAAVGTGLFPGVGTTIGAIIGFTLGAIYGSAGGLLTALAVGVLSDCIE